jgi:CSLREA domain-containing protein
MSDFKNMLRALFPSSFRASSMIAAFMFLFCLFAAQSAQAQLIFTVTRSDDRNATCITGVDCSLREAVKAANATVSNDTINFAPDVTTITLASEIVISNNGALTISGNGAIFLTIDGGPGTNRIFYTNLATVTITGVTLTGGNGTGTNSNGSGGAIYVNEGTLALNSVHVTANSTGATTLGGGIAFFGGTNHQILNSTFSANTAFNCGGFYNINGTIAVTNSTISGNSAVDVGGGFCSGANNANITLRHVTITANTAGRGGGISIGAGILNLGNTIVAGNTGSPGPDIRVEVGSTITTAGYNLIGNNSGVTAQFPAGNPNANNDIVGTSATPVNPLLDPTLKLFGAPVPIHALLFGSPALDKGFSFGLTTDQRGLLRPVNLDDATYPNAIGGDGSDIGAFEAQTAPLAPTAATVAVSGYVTSTLGRGISGIQLSLTDSEGNIRTATTTTFGYYRFEDVEVGKTYILSATGKRYTFSQPVQVLNVNEEANEVNFIANAEKRSRVF